MARDPSPRVAGRGGGAAGYASRERSCGADHPASRALGEILVALRQHETTRSSSRKEEGEPSELSLSPSSPCHRLSCALFIFHVARPSIGTHRYFSPYNNFLDAFAYSEFLWR